MKGKTIFVPGAQTAEVVAGGDAELGVAQGSEIVPIAGAQLVGPLPQRFLPPRSTREADHPRRLMLSSPTGPEAAPVFKTKGFDPG
jgi:molybdate transport system substrate-binding protein